MRAMPHLVQVHRRLGRDGLVIVALSNESRGKVEAVVQGQKLPFAVGAESSSFAAYGVSGIPAAFLIDAKGRIAWSGHPDDPAWERLAEKLLEKTAAP
ncbi:MAG TPA: TlpA disulfide reductase family protein [Planctomycetota bacterium]